VKFAQRLKKLRIDHNMTQEEFAERLSVSRQAVSKYESGEGYPEIEKLILISRMFRVSIDYLLGETDEYNVKQITKELQIASDEILNVVSEKTGLRKEDILGKSRDKNIVKARGIAMYLLRKHTEGSISAIADVFGREYVTVMHAITSIEKDLENKDEYITKLIGEIERELEYLVMAKSICKIY